MSVPFYAVIGNPIAHSKSPEIHAHFAHQCGIELRYERILAPIEPADAFGRTVDELRAQGLAGCNVTVPFKLAACAYAHRHSDDVRWAGAANTLGFRQGVAQADNTDGVGLVRDLSHNLGLDLAEKSILLLGAGGAARGVLRPLLLRQPRLLVVKNRSLDKAQAWLRDIAANSDFDAVRGACELRVCAWTGDADEVLTEFDVVINATASGLSDQFAAPSGVSLTPNTLAYDMMYGKPTAFMAWAQSQHARIADGWGMLVEQAAQSFAIWHGVAPDTRELLQGR